VNWPLQRDSKVDVSSASPSSKRIRRASTRNVSFQISLWGPIHIINPVDKTKLSCYTPLQRSTTVSLETYPLDMYVSWVWLTYRPTVPPTWYQILYPNNNHWCWYSTSLSTSMIQMPDVPFWDPIWGEGKGVWVSHILFIFGQNIPYPF